MLGIHFWPSARSVSVTLSCTCRNSASRFVATGQASLSVFVAVDFLSAVRHSHGPCTSPVASGPGRRVCCQPSNHVSRCEMASHGNFHFHFCDHGWYRATFYVPSLVMCLFKSFAQFKKKIYYCWPSKFLCKGIKCKYHHYFFRVCDLLIYCLTSL